MKRFLYMILVCLLFAGCNKKDGNEAKESISSVNETSASLTAKTGSYSFVTKEVPATTEEVFEAPKVTRLDYADKNSWVYCGLEENGSKVCDVFIVGGEAELGEELLMQLDDAQRKLYKRDIDIQKGVFSHEARVYAPYVHELGLASYGLMRAKRDVLEELVYEDVKASFLCYMENYNDGRPLILAAYSYGCEFVYRLMEDYFSDEDMYAQLVAVYAIGWPLDKKRADSFSQIEPARSMIDTGVVIAYDCEAKQVNNSPVIGMYDTTYAINPLNWKSDGTEASNFDNKGAVFFDEEGNITSEIENLCGCYVEKNRGVLKVVGLNVKDYPPVVRGFQEGAYHAYDYQLFYRNLQENVSVRRMYYLEKIGYE